MTLKQRLEDAARRFGFPAAELVRRAVEMKLPEWEQSGEFVIRSTPTSGPASRIRKAATAIVVSAILAGMALSAHAPECGDDLGTLPVMATSAE